MIGQFQNHCQPYPYGEGILNSEHTRRRKIPSGAIVAHKVCSTLLAKLQLKPTSQTGSEVSSLPIEREWRKLAQADGCLLFPRN